MTTTRTADHTNIEMTPGEHARLLAAVRFAVHAAGATGRDVALHDRFVGLLNGLTESPGTTDVAKKTH